MRLVLAAVLAVAAAACGVDRTVIVNNPTPTPTPTATPSVASSASPTPTTTPSPVPTPLVSSRGGIVVKQPLANARVRSPLTVSGDASVFEATLSWKVTDTAGRVLASGITTASAGGPQRGTFTISAVYTDPQSEIIGFAEVFTRSMRDGTIDEIVRVPLVLVPKG